MTGETGGRTVLVVDDEKEVADAYALRLQGEFDTETAYSGEEALSLLDERIDVVLLDRRMPEMSGDEVLAEIREGPHDPRVIMLTAVNPDFGIVEMPFDDYLCKPIDRADIIAAVEGQLRTLTYDRLSEYFELAAKRSVLEAQLTSQERETNEEYRALNERVESLKAELADTVESFGDLEADFESVDRQPM